MTGKTLSKRAEMVKLLGVIIFKSVDSPTRDRPADIVVNVDDSLKQGAEGTTKCRAMCLQILSAGVRRIRGMVLLRTTRKGIYVLQSWLS